MRVLVIGGGGREHALVWKIAQSPLVKKIFCAPGNAGIGKLAECVSIPAEAIDRLFHFASTHDIDLTVAGPDDSLALGIVDRFQRGGLIIFGPTKRASEIEWSKVYAKNLMRKHGIPTAESLVFDSCEAVLSHLESAKLPVVVKADGLAKGKGVLICKTFGEARAAIDVVMKEKRFGSAGDKVIVEDFLEGEEASIIAFTDGRTIAPMPSSQDHKRALDGDQGLNTGGMGAYSPAPVITDELYRILEREILIPTVHALNVDDRQFRGCLYAGIIITSDGPKVLEFNARFGDPETQPLLLRLQSDIVPILQAIVAGRLNSMRLKWDPRPSVCVVMASAGYPGSYGKGKKITGIDDAEALGDTTVFHAGPAMVDGSLVTNGGRVLGVTSLGDTIERAAKRAYEAVDKIRFDGAHYRSDIAARAIGRKV